MIEFRHDERARSLRPYSETGTREYARRQVGRPTSRSRLTQPCIPPGSLNRVPASSGVREGMSPLPGGR